MLDTVRRGPAARRGLAVTAVLGAAGLAITALTGAGLAAAAPHRETTAGRPVPAARRDGQTRFPVPAGHPFAVLLDDNAEVVSMASGRVLRVVRPPGTSREFLWAAAAARAGCSCSPAGRDLAGSGSACCGSPGTGGRYRCGRSRWRGGCTGS